ncbi:MAG: tetratricopeptide repeat protein, partial [Armatimonadota bacterium]|nr:tetratricopeptide repeat protein [Armatimonadota bacterium]
TMDLATPLWRRPFVAADALMFDLGKLLCPTHLGIDYGRGPVWLRAHGGGYGAGAVIAALGLGVWALRRRCPALFAGTGLFVTALLPPLGLTPFVFQVYSTVADRYLYLALLGPAFLLAAGLVKIRESAPMRVRLAAFSTCALLLMGCAARSVVQTRTWNNSIPLFTQALEVNPQSWVACNNLGAVALDQRQPLDALPLLAEAVRLRPGYAEAHANRGIALLMLGARPDAEREFRTAARLKPDYLSAYTGLGDA